MQLPMGEGNESYRLTPEQKRTRLLAVLTQWTVGAARTQPMAMVIEAKGPLLLSMSEYRMRSPGTVRSGR